jgi:hypothetical protein
MDIRALLFEPKTFALDNDGTRTVPAGVRAALRRRQDAVHKLLAVLTDQRQQPILPDAVQFDRCKVFAIRKSLVHRIERQLDEPGDALPGQLTGQWPRVLTSDWELDRIAAYLLGISVLGTPAARSHARHPARDVREALAAARRELDLVRAADQPVLMPLHYSLRWVEAAGRAAEPQLADELRDLPDELRDLPGELRDLPGELRSLADAVDRVIVAKAGLDSGGQVRELLSRIRVLASGLDAASATSRPG